MYALKVSINNQAPTVGGADDLGVLSAILSCAGPLGPKSIPSRPDQTPDFSFRLGGLTKRAKEEQDEHMVWLEQSNLKPGDRVFIEIIETDTPDAIIGGQQAQERADDEREYFEHCKRAYLEMRDKYEPEA